MIYKNVIELLQDTIDSHKADIEEAALQLRALTKKIEDRTAAIDKEQRKILKLVLENKNAHSNRL